MGRYDFRPLQVYQTAHQLVSAGRHPRPPPWHDVIGNIPPATALVRTQPIQHQQQNQKNRTKKASKLFMPQKITYEEDILRKEFFKDHPWELARPRMIIEDDAKDPYKTDWRQIQQPEKALSGESVVQRQMWLLRNNPGMTKASAYDQARKEFYHLRLQEDVERRIAREEALHTGAYFGKSAMEVGMELEDKEFEKWKAWAKKEIEVIQQKQAAMYTGLESQEDGAVDADLAEDTLQEEVVTEPAKGLGL